MAYNINLTNGATLVTLADGTTDTTYSSLTLIGKNFAGYGEFLNENFVKLLENFAHSTAPSNPMAGQLWWDSSTGVKTMKVYTGSVWKSVGGSTASSAAPTTPLLGDTWWDTVSGQLKVWDGSAWVIVGPAFTAAQGQSGAIAEAIVDNNNNSHVIVKFYVSNVVVAVLSKDAAFTLGGSTLSGFTTINPGFTLSANSNYLYNGDSYNSLRLGGVLASEYMRLTVASTLTQKLTVNTDDGISIGNPSNVDINIVAGDLIIKNRAANKNIVLSVMSQGVQTEVFKIDGTTGKALVYSDPSTNFGIATKQYVDNSISGPSALALARGGSNTITGVILPDGNNTRNFGSSAARYATVYATTFNGVSTSAQYADLAERFAADKEYSPGTVVELGGAEEITAVNDALSERVFGVISTKAAYLMNAGAGSDRTHPAVAVQGRVPVNVVGKVTKGDRLVSAGNGLAKAACSAADITPFNVIGRALEDKTTNGEGTVEAVVRLNS